MELQETAAGISRGRRSSAALITEDDMGKRVSFIRALSNEDGMGIMDEEEEEEDSDSDGGKEGVEERHTHYFLLKAAKHQRAELILRYCRVADTLYHTHPHIFTNILQG